MVVENKDIIITDPCYIVHSDEDWAKTYDGEYMEILGFSTCETNSTICGDWSCTTYDINTNEKLGNFCSDAGMVGVFILDEVLKYNPNFDYHIKRPWTTTLIKNFTGEINIGTVIVTTPEGEDYEEVRVLGTGSIDFYTTQTGA